VGGYIPAVQNGGIVLSGPSADGAAGDALVTDGSGGLSFSTLVSAISPLTLFAGAANHTPLTLVQNQPSPTAAVFRAVINSLTAAVISAGGNVGLGTASPAGRLHVKGTDFPITRFERDAGSGTTGMWAVQDLTVTTAGTPAVNEMALGQLFNINSTNIARIIAQQGGQAGQYGRLILRTANGSTPNTSDSDRLVVTESGLVGIGAITPTVKLDVDGNTVRIRSARTPASPAAGGAQGEVCWDANYIYVCVAGSTWKRAPLSTW
jgi:hypothetical protein